MKQTIRLTESELRQMIEESINETMQDEGFLDQMTQGAKSFFGKGDMGKKSRTSKSLRSGDGGMNLGKRWNAAKENFKSQGVLDKNNEMIKWLKSFIQNNGLTVSNTIGELWGKLDNQKAMATKRGSNAQNAIYRN